MNNIFKFISSLISFFAISNYLSGQTISFEDYLPLKAGAEKIYCVRLIKGSDTIKKDDVYSFCRSHKVEDKEVFYFEDGKDAGDRTTIGSNSFCAGAFYFDQGRFFLAPIYWKYELSTIKLTHFGQLFPARIFIDTIYGYGWNNRVKYKFTGFEDLVIEKKKFKNCLKLTITQAWNPYQPVDTIWFHKKTGIVKWSKSTERIEELRVKNRPINSPSIINPGIIEAPND